MSQHTVAQSADVPEGCMSLVTQLLQTQHGTITTVCEWGLKQLKDLFDGGRMETGMNYTSDVSTLLKIKAPYLH